jgi:hypothetical protein
MQLTRLYSALAQSRPFELDELVPNGLAGVPDDADNLVGLTPVRALALAGAHPDVVGAGGKAHQQVEQLVGRAWTWLISPRQTAYLRGTAFGIVGADYARDAAHEEVRATLLLLALDDELPRPQVTESAIKTLRNRESNRIGAAKMLRDLVSGPVSMEVLDSLSHPDAGLLINSDAVRSISDTGVHHLESVLKHFLDVGAYVWWWARRSVLAGVDQAESWCLAFDGLVPPQDSGDPWVDQGEQLENVQVLQRTLHQLERVVIERAMHARIHAVVEPRVPEAKPIRPPLCSVSSRRARRMLV